jgi:hypothetical protein
LAKALPQGGHQIDDVAAVRLFLGRLDAFTPKRRIDDIRQQRRFISGSESRLVVQPSAQRFIGSTQWMARHSIDPACCAASSCGADLFHADTFAP